MSGFFCHSSLLLSVDVEKTVPFVFGSCSCPLVPLLLDAQRILRFPVFTTNAQVVSALYSAARRRKLYRCCCVSSCIAVVISWSVSPSNATDCVIPSFPKDHCKCAYDASQHAKSWKFMQKLCSKKQSSTVQLVKFHFQIYLRLRLTTFLILPMFYYLRCWCLSSLTGLAWRYVIVATLCPFPCPNCVYLLEDSTIPLFAIRMWPHPV